MNRWGGNGQGNFVDMSPTMTIEDEWLRRSVGGEGGAQGTEADAPEEESGVGEGRTWVGL